MDRKERILAYIRSKEYIPLKFSELKAVLGVPSEDETEFLKILDELCGEGSVYITKRGRYASSGRCSNTEKGVLKCSARGFFGFVICDDGGEDIFVAGENMGTALNGDRVLVKIDTNQPDGAHKNGHIIKILERGNTTVTGTLHFRKFMRLIPDKKQLYSEIRIEPEDLNGAAEGDRVAASIVKYSENGTILGRIDVNFGDGNSLKSCVDGIIFDSKISTEFSDEVMKFVNAVPEEISAEDIKGRTDLRDEMIFTIDGDTARDFDDAVSVKMLDNGNFLLGVHIADVSHYVTLNSPPDKEAYKRGTSVYLADRVIPMLPEKLSNGLCSLNPNTDRLTLSVFMEINSSGEVLRHSIEKSVIRSKYRLTYNNVTALLDGSAELALTYKEIVPALKTMELLADILRKKRKKRGAIQFDFPETEILVDENGFPSDIARAEKGISNGIIEEFMLCANETVAEYAFWAELPFIYRVHEPPSQEKITVFNEFIRNFGLVVKGGKDGEIHPKALQQILDAVSGTPEERMVASNMLRSLMKAEYRADNAGHFGLAAKYYCHFTSPIRRYPDLVIHRILKAFADGTLSDGINTEKAAKHSSECEIAAETLERETEDLMKAAYMSSYVGESFDGIISGVTNFGMFAELENSIEGLIRVENMSGDYFVFDELNKTLTGKRNGRTYKIGDHVRITVAAADLLSHRIDFVLAEDMTGKMFRKFNEKEIKLPKRKKGGINTRKFIKKKYGKH